MQSLDCGRAAQLVKTVRSCLLQQNMETRIHAVKVTKVLHSGHTFKSIKEFLPGVLPTNREVICPVLNEEKFLQFKAARTVAEEFVEL